VATLAAVAPTIGVDAAGGWSAEAPVPGGACPGGNAVARGGDRGSTRSAAARAPHTTLLPTHGLIAARSDKPDRLCRSRRQERRHSGRGWLLRRYGQRVEYCRILFTSYQHLERCRAHANAKNESRAQLRERKVPRALRDITAAGDGARTRSFNLGKVPVRFCIQACVKNLSRCLYTPFSSATTWPSPVTIGQSIGVDGSHLNLDRSAPPCRQSAVLPHPVHRAPLQVAHGIL
jgi:hypothetical protein